MKRKRYIYSPEKLRFEEVRLTSKRFVKKALSLLFLILLLSGFVTYIFLQNFPTPREKKLAYENLEMQRLYEEINHQITELSRNLEHIRDRDARIYRSIFDIPPMTEPVKKAGTGGAEQYKLYSSFSNRKLIAGTVEHLERLMTKTRLQQRSMDELYKLASGRKEELLRIPAIQPVENDDLSYTGAGFGMRLHPILQIYRMHEGIDFVVPYGSEIYATANGRVKSIRRSSTFGKYIVADHGNGYETLYAHLSEIRVRRGQQLERGDIIGLSGNTGLSSGAHLHYEVHRDKRAVNPVPYFFKDLSPDEFIALRAMADSIQQSMD